MDRAHHRPVAGDSEIAEQVKVAARAHQAMIWSRVRQVNALRSLWREYYPAALVAFGTDLADRDALAILAVAPSPERGRRLSQARVETVLRKASRQRNIAATAATIKTGLRSQQLTARPGVVGAYAASALIAVRHTWRIASWQGPVGVYVCEGRCGGPPDSLPGPKGRPCGPQALPQWALRPQVNTPSGATRRLTSSPSRGVFGSVKG